MFVTCWSSGIEVDFRCLDASNQGVSVALDGDLKFSAEILYYIYDVWRVEDRVKEGDSRVDVCAGRESCYFVLQFLESVEVLLGCIVPYWCSV